MPYRGRLIFPLIADLARLNTAATQTASGYDDVFRSPKISYPSGATGPRVSSRVEHTVIQLRCQVEASRFAEQHQQPSGNAPNHQLGLVFHFVDLEAAGLVDLATGDALIRVNDRLVALRRLNGTLAQTIPMPAGLYATEVQPIGLGLGGDRNLLLVQFNDRPQGLVAGGG